MSNSDIDSVVNWGEKTKEPNHEQFVAVTKILERLASGMERLPPRDQTHHEETMKVIRWLPIIYLTLQPFKKNQNKKYTTGCNILKTSFTENIYIGTVSDTFSYTNSVMRFQFNHFLPTNIFLPITTPSLFSLRQLRLSRNTILVITSFSFLKLLHIYRICDSINALRFWCHTVDIALSYGE